jgi:tRNA-2-methylthio-N6-dimethylallyladenosine synthase
LPVQSGDNNILKKMKRGYTREHYLAIIEKIKQKIPDAYLTTDIIVGFPGESEKQFQNTVDLIKKAGFKNVYVARYSPRPGTEAYYLKDDVPEEVKRRREKELRALVRVNCQT